jgi:uncharacterized protein
MTADAQRAPTSARPEWPANLDVAALIADGWRPRPFREFVVKIHSRLFEEIIQLLLGGLSATEAVGLAPVEVLVIETDGGIELSDSLKSAYPAVPETGAHVARNSFDSVLFSSYIAARQIGLKALCSVCLACPEKMVCGGGLYAHRYQAGITAFRKRVQQADEPQLS